MATEREVVDVTVGEEFTVTLDAMSGGGYTWDTDYDASKVELVESVASPGTSPGASKVTRMRFRAVAPGDEAVELRYGRPWEQTPLKTVTYRVAGTD